MRNPAEIRSALPCYATLRIPCLVIIRISCRRACPRKDRRDLINCHSGNLRWSSEADYPEPRINCNKKPRLASGFFISYFPPFHGGTQGGYSAYCSGTLISNTLPLPTSLSTVASPRCASAMCLTMASPKPVPPNSLLRERSTR